MNMTKNGIPIYVKPSSNYGKPYRAAVSHHIVFVTLMRMEGFTRVWLVQSFDKQEVKQLKKEGLKVEEIWNQKEMVQ